MTVLLNEPICSSVGEKVAFCRRIDSKFRLIGWGTIKSGKIFKNLEWLINRLFQSSSNPSQPKSDI